MTLDTEDQQQIENVKKWLAENGMFTFITIIIIGVLFFAYQQWQKFNEREMATASVNFEKLLDNLGANKVDLAKSAAVGLFKDHPHSTYAKLAENLLAKNDVNQKEYVQAEKKLMDVIETAKLPALKEIARVRLARIQIQLQQPQLALDTLSKVENTAYLPVISAVEGDAYVGLHNTNAARASYQRALSALPEEAILHSLVSMKLNNLPS